MFYYMCSIYLVFVIFLDTHIFFPSNYYYLSYILVYGLKKKSPSSLRIVMPSLSS